MPLDWISMIPAAVQGVSTLLGAGVTGNANENAAGIARDTSQQNIQTIIAQNEKAAKTLDPLARYASPGMQYMSTVMSADPNRLTPAQEIDLEDRTRAAKIAVPNGLRGSGRYVTASVNDVQNRAKAGMIAANTQRADTMAGRVAATGTGAVTNQANIQSGQGGQVAQQNTYAGDAAGNAATATGTSDAATLGSIGSFFANAMKDGERESRYGTFKAAA